MLKKDGPGLVALAERSLVLFVLIVRAAWLYFRTWASGRGALPLSGESLERRYTRFATRFVDVATRYRGGLIKMGQVASLRLDVIPEEITDQLSRLQDRVPPHPFEEVERQLCSELGGSVSTFFASFEPDPEAAASLGQVHAAVTHAGQKVAVKVLYPGIERSVAVDLAMTQLALWAFNWISVADLMQVYREIRASLLGEMDYVREGRAAEEVAKNLSSDGALFPHLRIPAIHWETTRTRVLTMEFIEGDKINDREALEARGVDMDEIVLWASRAFLHMMFRDGFFHCDPHPGNLLVDEQGRVGIIDFGMNQRITPEVLAAVRKNVMATVARDPDLYVESLLDLEVIQPRDRQAVRALAELSFDPEYFNLTPQEVVNLDFGKYFERMREQMKQIRSFSLPDGVVMWSRAFSLLYGLTVELAPGLRPLDVVGPYVLEFLQGGGAAGRVDVHEKPVGSDPL